MSSQIGYIIIIANGDRTTELIFDIFGNLVDDSSTKSKRVTRSVLASEIYGMVGGVDMAKSIEGTIRMIMDQQGSPIRTAEEELKMTGKLIYGDA